MQRTSPDLWLTRLTIAVSVLVLLVGGIATLAWPGATDTVYDLRVGEVSTTDIRAPQRIVYESAILTEEARRQAEAAVSEWYDPPQPRIRQQQVARAHDILAFIETVRADDFADDEQRLDWIASIPDVELTEVAIRRLLELPEDSWQHMMQEVPEVVDRAMREEIREGQLSAARRRVSIYIDPSLRDDEAEVVADLARTLLRPNSFHNPERTADERQRARERVEPRIHTVEQGEIIVRAGDIVRPLDMEVLEVLGLTQPRRDEWAIARASILMLLVVTLIGAFMARYQPGFWHQRHQAPMLALLFLSFLVLARVMAPAQSFFSYFFPMASLTMIASALLHPRIGLLTTLLFALLLSYITAGRVEYITFAIMGALVGMVVLGRAERATNFIWAGICVALTNIVVLSAFHLPGQELELISALQLASAAIVNGGLSSSLTLISFHVLGGIFGITTTMQLQELSRPTHPLLRQLLLQAPGTYHHTILVSNMSERAAAAIGADALLTRVGAYYHDIGKTVRPYFFVENQGDGVNPHDRLDPETSAEIIISHVTDGLELARKYRLPRRIRDFIAEHQGTQLVSYFYHQARQEMEEGAEEPDARRFSYPGPRPQSKETAIVMLADVCEATVRALHPQTTDELDRVLRKVIQDRILSGELDDSELTMRDLTQIRNVFLRVLQGVHHPRIQYPDADPEAAQRSSTASFQSEQHGRIPDESPPLRPEPADA